MLYTGNNMQNAQDQFKINDNIIEIPLPGEKLGREVNDLNIINHYGNDLFKKNSPFIREHVPDTWFAAIEPISGKFIASNQPFKLYEYTSEKYPGKLMYVIGLLKENLISFLINYEQQ